MLEDHATAPFLGLKHNGFLFRHSTGIEEATFFAGMAHDPLSFLSLTVT